ncbi:MAG: ABC transporter substrate-binding protein [Hydrogenophaga sp.]|nr:ABC transporter substrate-binding protein [Hydrogenophaga sp.]
MFRRLLSDRVRARAPETWSCACAQPHPSAGACSPTAAGGASVEAHIQQTQEAALLKALFPSSALRRQLLQTVGAASLRAAVAAVLPAGALVGLQAMAQDQRPPEKKDLKLGFLPITCATPLIGAEPMGLYQRRGLNVQLVKIPGWGPIRDRMLKGELDATHFLSPMPLAMSLGLGSPAQPMHVASIQNTNGNAITLHQKHKDNRDPKNWKGMRFGIPFEHSMHNYLLRYYLAEHGLNPDKDVTLQVMAPPDMLAQLKSQAIDGFIVAEPFNQRAVFEGVGFIHLLTRAIWDGHPCCAFGVSAAFIQQYPDTFSALYRAIISASVLASMPSSREQMVQAIAQPQYLNQPPELLMQVMTGQYDDGLGNRHDVPDRILFDPVPWHSQAIWMLTQMKRWGYLKSDVNFQQIADQVFLLTDAKKQMAQAGWRAPEGTMRPHRIMGKPFDATRPDDYLRSFPIRVGA